MRDLIQLVLALVALLGIPVLNRPLGLGFVRICIGRRLVVDSLYHYEKVGACLKLKC
jgi:hypothetical protein